MVSKFGSPCLSFINILGFLIFYLFCTILCPFCFNSTVRYFLNSFLLCRHNLVLHSPWVLCPEENIALDCTRFMFFWLYGFMALDVGWIVGLCTVVIFWDFDPRVATSLWRKILLLCCAKLHFFEVFTLVMASCTLNLSWGFLFCC